jgi:membrane protease YdiL (CAAX protease family)
LAVNFLVTLLGAGLLAPVAEELFFRGLIHRWFRARFGLWPAVVISSAIFAAGHADSIGVVASTFVLGMLLAAVYDRSLATWKRVVAIVVGVVLPVLAVSLIVLIVVALSQLE